MAKELPYFRFTVSEWLNDDISLENYETKGVFSDVCAFYWFKDCTLDLETLEKRFRDAKATLEILIKLEIIKHDLETDSINILFLDKQYDLLSEKRQKYVEAGRKGGLRRSSNAKASLKQRSSYKDKDKENDKIKINEFWDSYHSITKQLKTDKDPSKKYWNALSEKEKQKAIDNIQPYYDSLNDKKYCKKARTYLSDKSFNDEFKKVKTIPKDGNFDYTEMDRQNRGH